MQKDEDLEYLDPRRFRANIIGKSDSELRTETLWSLTQISLWRSGVRRGRLEKDQVPTQ